MFDQQSPISAKEAANKRVGDVLNLDGADVRVTLLGKSRVYYVEGEGPEGEVLGSEANYFNAEAGRKMIVVSWTGDEVEFYHGITITATMVSSAFNISPEQITASLGSNESAFDDDSDSDESSGGSYFSGGSSSSPGFGSILFIGIIIAYGLFRIYGDFSWGGNGGTSRPVVKRYPAPVDLLKAGSSGKLNGANYQVLGRTTVDIAESAWYAERHEYYLRDDNGQSALLICGLKPNSKDWFLFTPLYVGDPMTPQAAGNVRMGQKLNIGEVHVAVTELFRSTLRGLDNADMPVGRIGEDRFGFGGQSGTNLLFARWSADRITFHQCSRLDPKTVSAAFGTPNPN